MPKVAARSPRVSWIDTLKTVSIFFVLMAHTGRTSASITPYFGSFFMPVFFFISGLFVKGAIREQSWVSFVQMRVQRLLIPYLTFGIVSYLLWFFLIGRVSGDPLPENPVMHFVMNTLYGVAGYGWFEYNITLWFFPCLFTTEIFFFYLLRMPSRQLLIATLVVLSVVGYFYFVWFDVSQWRLPFGLDIAITAVVFYGIGYLVKPYLFNEANQGWYSGWAWGLSAIVYVISSRLNEESAFAIGAFGKNYFYFYLAALSGILFWLQCSRWIQANRICEAIGKNTLVIFPLHPLVFSFLTGALVYLLKIPKVSLDRANFSDLIGLGYAIAALAILVPMAEFLNRYTPWLLGRTGKPSTTALSQLNK